MHNNLKDQVRQGREQYFLTSFELLSLVLLRDEGGGKTREHKHYKLDLHVPPNT